MIKSRSTIATPPGATIKELLVDREMSQKEFASRMAMSEKHISKLINGEVLLTPDVSVRLEMVLGAPAQFWNNLESIYREKIVRVRTENDMDEDISLAQKLPYNEMAKKKWVSSSKKGTDQVVNLRKFFEVAELKLLWEKPLFPKVACRRLLITEKSDSALIVWAQKAKLEARSIETKPFNKQKLKTIIPQIRAMTMIDQEILCPKLTSSLADCGIAIVFLPHMNGSFLHGATFRDGNKIVLGVTVRGRDADKFWFSLFHELAHILFGHIQKNEMTDEDEIKCDSFAAEILIPKANLARFIEINDFCRESIVGFAKSINIAAGIVVGRLQKDKHVSYTLHNSLKTKFTIPAVQE